MSDYCPCCGQEIESDETQVRSPSDPELERLMGPALKDLATDWFVEEAERLKERYRLMDLLKKQKVVF